MLVASLKHDRADLAAVNHNLLNRPTRIAGESLQPRSVFFQNSGMTMTMTHSEKSSQCLSAAWPYRRERRGHDTTKESLLKQMRLALLPRCVLAHC